LGWLAVEEAVSLLRRARREPRRGSERGWRRAGFDETFERNSTEVGGHARDSMEDGGWVWAWQQHAPEGPKAAVSLKRIVSLFISSHGK
jgi:hypothetical protein